MKRQIFYVIVVYAAWLTYQDINEALQETSHEKKQSAQHSRIADPVVDAKKIAAYVQTTKSADCTEQQGCDEQNRTLSRHD